MMLCWKTKYESSPLRVLGLRVQTPVNDVEEQVGQRKHHPGVGVDHVAVAHDEAQVPSQRLLPAQSGALRGCGDGGVPGLGVPLRVWRAGHLREGSQVDLVVVEAAVKRHGLGGVVGAGDLHSNRFVFEFCRSSLGDFRGSEIESHLCRFELLHLLHGGEIVDCSVLNDGQEDKQEARPQVNVHSFDVRHLRH